MKQSIAPTDFILIHAGTNSNWARCHFALIHVTQTWLHEINLRCSKAMQFEEDESFYHVIFDGAPHGFYYWPDEESSWRDSHTELLPMGLETWCFITITLEEIKTQLLRVNSLNTFQLCIDGKGEAWYKATGKSTDEEFYTETFNIPDILAQVIAI